MKVDVLTHDVSIIIPVFERLDLLTLTLNSLAEQDYCGLTEVIVCDDGSACSGGIQQVVQRFSAETKWEVRYIWQPHQRNVSRSRNNGIRAARGAILVFVDGDNIVPPGFISRHAYAHSRPRMLVCGSRDHLFLVPNDVDELLKLTGSKLPLALNTFSRVSFGPFQQSVSEYPWLTCISSNMSVQHSPEVKFNEDFRGWGGEDTELACRLLHQHGYIHLFDPSLIVYSPEIEATRKEFTFLRPKTHEAIVEFLENATLLMREHPAVDHSALLSSLRWFYLGPEDKWLRLSTEHALRRRSEDAARMVAAWQKRRGRDRGSCQLPARGSKANDLYEHEREKVGS